VRKDGPRSTKDSEVEGKGRRHPRMRPTEAEIKKSLEGHSPFIPTIAIFDEMGTCLAVSTGGVPEMPHAHEAQVEAGSRPDDLYWCNKSGKPRKPRRIACARSLVDLPERVGVGDKVVVTPPPGVVIEVDGEKHDQPFELDTSQASVKRVKALGAKNGASFIHVVTYAEARALDYPQVVEQLDLLFHSLKAIAPDSPYVQAIQKVKDANPKEAK
jgi:hypothetical protein